MHGRLLCILNHVCQSSSRDGRKEQGAVSKIFTRDGSQDKVRNLGSPGLVVMGGGSCSEGCGFDSQHHTLDGHFSNLFVVKIVMCV